MGQRQLRNVRDTVMPAEAGIQSSLHQIWIPAWAGMTIGIVLLFTPACMAQDRVEAEESFPWGIHLIAVPLILIFGVFIGWSLRERKQAQDDARKQLSQKS